MPAPRLKPLAQQRIVLTGATSGIGLATARLLATRGAALMLVARSADGLERVATELRGLGSGRIETEAADVADAGSMRGVARVAADRLGGFDSWINDAGAFLYGRLDETTLADQHRVFDVVYWGTVHGTLAAAETLRASGGAIVNVGSVLGDMAIPYQGPYCAAKHAVHGFTEAFRREIEADRLPVSVSLIKPAAIDTPFMEHARNRMGSPGTRNPPPAYHPDLVARAIAHCCAHPARDIVVGGSGGLAPVVANTVAPRAMDWVFARAGKATMVTDDSGDPAAHDNLYQSRKDGAERGSLRPFTRRTSLLLEAQLHPVATTVAMLAGVGLTLGAAAARRR